MNGDSWIILGLICLIIAIISFYSAVAPRKAEEAFEAGAHLTMLNHKTFNNYGSCSMRKYVFENYYLKHRTMPQSGDEMIKIVQYADKTCQYQGSSE